MRWNVVATLIPATSEVGSGGVAAEVRGEGRDVFANALNIGLTTWSIAFANGLRADARIEMWSEEYQGEPIVSMDGVEYDVANVYDRGLKTTLTLTRRARNAIGGQ